MNNNSGNVDSFKKRMQEMVKSRRQLMSVPTPEPEPAPVKSYQTCVPLTAGENHVLLDVPGMVAEQITLTTTCGAQLKNFFHGDSNLLTEGQEPIEISKLADSSGWRLQSIPGEEFHAGLPTTLQVQAVEAGELNITFSKRAL